MKQDFLLGDAVTALLVDSGDPSCTTSHDAELCDPVSWCSMLWLLSLVKSRLSWLEFDWSVHASLIRRFKLDVLATDNAVSPVDTQQFSRHSNTAMLVVIHFDYTIRVIDGTMTVLSEQLMCRAL